jgi:hypothetical protein
MNYNTNAQHIVSQASAPKIDATRIKISRATASQASISHKSALTSKVEGSRSFDSGYNAPLYNLSVTSDSKATKKRWLCNVSASVKLSKTVENGLNISSRGKLTQYELMVKLLKAETCDVIYFDCQLRPSQIGILKMLQVFSNTEIVHSRLSMQFNRAMG